MKSPFLSKRSGWLDGLLLAAALAVPHLFSLALILAAPAILPGTPRRKMLHKLFSKPSPLSQLEEARDIWLLTVIPHMREKTMLKTFGDRIHHVLIMSDADGEIFTARGVTVEHIKRDWLAAWLAILVGHHTHRLFIVSGLSDLWFMPLKRHPLHRHIAFDAYDPVAEYRHHPLLTLINKLNYRLGTHYIVRDARFTQALRAHKNRTAHTCYLPDAAQFEVIDKAAMLNKFSSTEPIRFVSAGWVTAEGDGGILRSFALIRHLWPEAEIHLCLTQFMKPEDPQFAPLVAFIQSQQGCYLHQNLQGEAYKALLDSAQVGLNLHDPNVFGEPYQEFSLSMVRRSPSARVLDFATRGCILMTSAQQRFSSHMFKRHSPHGQIIHLSDTTPTEALSNALAHVRQQLEPENPIA